MTHLLGSQYLYNIQILRKNGNDVCVWKYIIYKVQIMAWIEV